MKTSTHLAKRLEEVLLNGIWIANTNFKDQLERVTWEQATYKIAELNTIAALTFHVNYYLAGLLQVFNGGSLDIRDKYSFDMSPIQSETDWKNLVDEFLTNAENFVHKVAAMPESRFEQPFVLEKYGSYLRNIEGVIEHCYYHLGQVVLVRKLVSQNGK